MRDQSPTLNAADLAAGQRALHTDDGGTWITSGHRVLRLKPTAPAPLEQPAEPRPSFFSALRALFTRT